MPGTTRSECGSPRFTRLGIGPASLRAARAYMSFGNVLEEPCRIGRYGVTNSIYVRHVWQRWGFDYRLPEIWPPGTWVGNHGTFAEMRETARRHGILFVLHDNYIDHYPDAAGFSYDDTVFDGEGAPVKAWLNFNKGKRAQS